MSNEHEHSSHEQKVNTNCAEIIDYFERKIIRVIGNNNYFTKDD